jgi:hypothetical protein
MNQLSPWHISPFAHLADLRPPDAPPSADVIEFAANCEKIHAIINTGSLDRFPLDERIRIGWNILRHDNEEIKH